MKKVTSVVLALMLMFNLVVAFGFNTSAEEINEDTLEQETSDGKLANPTNVHWENGIAKWNAVEGASTYFVVLYKDGKLIWHWYVDTTESDWNSYILGNYESDDMGPGTYTFSVAALTGMDAWDTASEGVISDEWIIKRLKTPKNLRWVGTNCVCDKVEGAGYYWFDIYKDGKLVTGSLIVDSNTIEVKDVLEKNGSGEYSFKVSALVKHPTSEGYDMDSNSYFSPVMPTYTYTYTEPSNKYAISIDKYLVATKFDYDESEDMYIGTAVDSAAPGDEIHVFYDNYNSEEEIPKGKYIKEIKYTGLDSNSEDFDCFDDANGVSMIFVMPENDVSLSAVLGDTENYIIDLSKGTASISYSVWLCLINSDYNSKYPDWEYDEKDSNGINWDLLDYDHDGVWDFKISGQESDYTTYKLIKNQETKIEGIINLTQGEHDRPAYYVSINFGSKDAGTIENTTSKSENFADAGLANSEEDLKNTVLTKEEKELLESGEDIKVWLDVDDISSSVGNSDKEKIDSAKPTGFSVGCFFDINLFKKIGDNKESKITDVPNGKVKIQITVPANLQKSGRTYKIVRIHNGVTTVLDVSQNGYTITFESDQFSTYALIFSDEVTPAEVKTPEEKTVDNKINNTSP